VDIQVCKSEGGYNVGWTATGEWLRYTVNVETPGTYTASFRVASRYSGSSITLRVDGVDACTIPIPATGSWNTYTTVSGTCTLSSGVHVLTVVLTGDPDLNYFTVS